MPVIKNPADEAGWYISNIIDFCYDPRPNLPAFDFGRGVGGGF
jgi:hypothetical protein